MNNGASKATVKSGSEAPPRKSWLGTRIGSVAALCGVLAGAGYVGHTVYGVATDAFVAPIVLSPDSDMVIQSKLSMSQLLAERIRITTRKEEIEAEVQAAEQAITKLEALQAVATRALEWTTMVTKKQAHGGSRELHALGSQRKMLASMLTNHESFVGQMKKDLDAGLVSRSDHAREMQVLSQLRVAALENDRARISSEVHLDQLMLVQDAMKKTGSDRMWTPEMLIQQDQLARVQCDLLKLQAEMRAKSGERRHIEAELAKLDDLIGQLKRRPVFRATEANTNVAFVPYTQMSGVKGGADVYDCFWGIASCTRVGRVAELLPGEVVVPDPWGTPARGQYAILDLDDQEAAHSRTLRVRPRSVPFSPSRSESRPSLAAR